ncbi:calcium-binding protein [Chelativorans alearense]|uniref:calcium-binding protein n=1 Tax=Chelativorans alearense TaxID=2681495 RepID=UPI0013D5D389|nr:calcium-binding protein [Chelativorans alearense]
MNDATNETLPGQIASTADTPAAGSPSGSKAFNRIGIGLRVFGNLRGGFYTFLSAKRLFDSDLTPEQRSAAGRNVAEYGAILGIGAASTALTANYISDGVESTNHLSNIIKNLSQKVEGAASTTATIASKMGGSVAKIGLGIAKAAKGFFSVFGFLADFYFAFKSLDEGLHSQDPVEREKKLTSYWVSLTSGLIGAGGLAAGALLGASLATPIGVVTGIVALGLFAFNQAYSAYQDIKLAEKVMDVPAGRYVLNVLKMLFGGRMDSDLQEAVLQAKAQAAYRAELDQDLRAKNEKRLKELLGSGVNEITYSGQDISMTKEDVYNVVEVKISHIIRVSNVLYSGYSQEKANAEVDKLNIQRGGENLVFLAEKDDPIFHFSSSNDKSDYYDLYDKDSWKDTVDTAKSLGAEVEYESAYIWNVYRSVKGLGELGITILPLDKLKTGISEEEALASAAEWNKRNQDSTLIAMPVRTQDTVQVPTNRHIVKGESFAEFDPTGITRFELGGGTDWARGHKLRQNWFEVESGTKYFTGGMVKDHFVLDGTPAPDKPSSFDGGEGADWIEINSLPAKAGGIDINLDRENGKLKYRADGKLVADLKGIENAVIGGVSDDHVIGNEAANELNSGGGRDTLEGLGGDDVLHFSADDGVLAKGGTGSDEYHLGRKSAQSAPTNATVTIEDADEEEESNTLHLDFSLGEVGRPELDGNDVVIKLANDDGSSTSLRLKDVYADNADGTKRLQSAFTFQTRDGFLIEPLWPEVIPTGGGFDGGAKILYLPMNDRTIPEGTKLDELTVHFTEIQTDSGPRKQLRIEGAGSGDRIHTLLDKFNFYFEGDELSDFLYGGFGDGALPSEDNLADSTGGVFELIPAPPEDAAEEDTAEQTQPPAGSGTADSARSYLRSPISRQYIDLQRDGNDVIVHDVRSGVDNPASFRLQNYMLGEEHCHITLVDAGGAHFEMGLDKEGDPYLSDEGTFGEGRHIWYGKVNSPNEYIAPQACVEAIGGDLDDKLTATAYSEAGAMFGDYLDGGKGNDTIVGSDGDDYLIGGDGDDVISDTGGDDLITPGTGVDTIAFGRKASGQKIVSFSRAAGSSLTVNLPFDVKLENFTRIDDSLAINGVAPESQGGSALTVILKDYFADIDAGVPPVTLRTPTEYGPDDLNENYAKKAPCEQSPADEYVPMAIWKARTDQLMTSLALMEMNADFSAAAALPVNTAGNMPQSIAIPAA